MKISLEYRKLNVCRVLRERVQQTHKVGSSVLNQI